MTPHPWAGLAQAIEDEVDEARARYPNQGNPNLLALHAEVGELTNAILNLHPASGLASHPQHVRNAKAELVQVMAMCVRLYEEGDTTLALPPLKRAT
ncbi:MAG: hypothetical protein AAGJ19_22055 [Myxococcota bacterium]